MQQTLQCYMHHTCNKHPIRCLTYCCAALRTVAPGRSFFRDLDRDGDGRVTLDDMKAAMRQRNLPEHYACEFVETARGGRWWSNSIRCANPLHPSVFLPAVSLSISTSTHFSLGERMLQGQPHNTPPAGPCHPHPLPPFKWKPTSARGKVV
jgi:EF-hand domain